jgi:hypothetical protein
MAGMQADEHIPLLLRLKAAALIVKAALTHPMTPGVLIMDGQSGRVEIIPRSRYEEERTQQRG